MAPTHALPQMKKQEANGPGGTAHAGSSVGEGLERQTRLEAKRQARKLFKNLRGSSNRDGRRGPIPEFFFFMA